EQAAASRSDLALAQLAAGQADAYRRMCGWLVEQLKGQKLVGGEDVAHDVARACVLRADAVPAEGWRSLAEMPIKDAVLRAAVLCGAGGPAEALAALGDDGGAHALLVRALAEHVRGNPAAAREALRQAAEWLDAAPEPPRWDGPGTRAED